MNKQPKPETLRKYYPDSKLTNHEIVKLAEWLRLHYKLVHISPGNKVLAALIAYKEYEQEMFKSSISNNPDDCL